jgi:hypothetical protein
MVVPVLYGQLHFTRRPWCWCVLLCVSECDERDTQRRLLFDLRLSYLNDSGHLFFKQTYEYNYLLFILYVVSKEIFILANFIKFIVNCKVRNRRYFIHFRGSTFWEPYLYFSIFFSDYTAVFKSVGFLFSTYVSGNFLCEHLLQRLATVNNPKIYTF